MNLPSQIKVWIRQREGGGSPNKIHICTEKESLSSFMRSRGRDRDDQDDEDGKKKWAAVDAVHDVGIRDHLRTN